MSGSRASSCRPAGLCSCPFKAAAASIKLSHFEHGACEVSDSLAAVYLMPHLQASGGLGACTAASAD